MIRFLADASLNHAIVSGCRRREPTMDFLSANEANLKAVSDLDVLLMAAAQDRILVSHDFKTMPQHFGEFLQAGSFSPGVILVSQHHPIREIIEELVLVWRASEPAEWQNCILKLPFV